MCGATGAQKSLEASQAQFYDTLTQHYKDVFGEQQGILGLLTSTFEPILKAGSGQKGMTAEEETTLRSDATEGVSRNFDKAQQALNGQLAARGSDFIPTGSDSEIRGELASTAAAESSNMQHQITEENYALGRENYDQAINVLGGVSAQENPNGYAGSANNAGGEASKTANDIAQADNSVWSTVVGGLSGIGGAAVGAWCPALGSMILMADGSLLRVEQIQKDMLVMGIDGQSDRIVETPQPVRQPAIRVMTASHAGTVSASHAYPRAPGGYTFAKDAQGETVFVGDSPNTAKEQVTAAIPLANMMLCFPLKLKRSHGYNADGIWSLE